MIFHKIRMIFIEFIKLICVYNHTFENTDSKNYEESPEYPIKENNSNINTAVSTHESIISQFTQDYKNGNFVGDIIKKGGMSYQSIYEYNGFFYFSKIVENHNIKKKKYLISEFKILRKISKYEYFCKSYSLVEDDIYTYIILKKYPIDLYNFIIKMPNLIPMNLIFNWGLDLLKAFNILHSEFRICHRDIKPENIVLDEYGNIVLIDFGLSQCQQMVTGAGTIQNTCPYMLELARQGKQELVDGYICDVWSLGIVMFNLITLKSPYDDIYNEYGKTLTTRGYVFYIYNYKEFSIGFSNRRSNMLIFLKHYFEKYEKRMTTSQILIEYNKQFTRTPENKFYKIFINSMKTIYQN